MDSLPQKQPSPASVKKLLARAVHVVGSQTRLAKKCGCSQQNISRALATGIVTIKLAMAIAWAVKARDPESDLEWQDLASQPPWNDD